MIGRKVLTTGSTAMETESVKKTSAAVMASLVVMVSGLTGCGDLNRQAASGPASVQGSALHGVVHGGQQPVMGATIQLYAAGGTGYGSSYAYASGTSLLGTNVVTSDANGSFNITGDYMCPSSTTEVYLVATGGNPGLKSGVNANLALMAALGPCGRLSSATGIDMNELTTVATVWALSPFMTGIANIGTSAGNAQGLANAFAVVDELVNISAGTVSGPALPVGAILPMAKIDTLADILASCIKLGRRQGWRWQCLRHTLHGHDGRRCCSDGHNQCSVEYRSSSGGTDCSIDRVVYDHCALSACSVWHAERLHHWDYVQGERFVEAQGLGDRCKCQCVDCELRREHCNKAGQHGPGSIG